ncbi:MAG: hypothetical protein OXE83_13345 [Gammaproteobacteria bacterium]|nr:hypothetical protein [Gammaproteobacteria bacterium]
MSVALKGKLAHGLLVGALLAIGGWASAAETEAPDDGAAAQADEAAEENAAADDGQPESHDVFLPTEEISEDFAVPFPVDI